MVDNKFFWKHVKPYLSDKVSCKDEIHLIENNELVKTDLDTFLSNIIQNLAISRYSDDEPYVNCIKVPTLKASLKYRKHPSIGIIQNECKDKIALVLLKWKKIKIKVNFEPRSK